MMGTLQYFIRQPDSKPLFYIEKAYAKPIFIYEPIEITPRAMPLVTENNNVVKNEKNFVAGIVIASVLTISIIIALKILNNQKEKHDKTV